MAPVRNLNSIAFAAFAVVAGVALPFQAAVNGQLRTLLGNPIRASFVSFAVGIALLIALALATRDPMPALAAVTGAPWWIWLGGILGAFYIVASIVVVPRLGSAFTFALVVAGQMAASLAIDRFGLFGVPPAAFSLQRLAGAALLVGGVLLVRK
ncbi:MAG: hypothetical protein NVS2B3_18060 [Vulcanimicrobiaceae bacterium]